MSYTEVPEHLSSTLLCGEDDVTAMGFDFFGFSSGLGFGNADDSWINGSDEYYGFSDTRIHEEVDNNDGRVYLEQGTMPSGMGWDES